MRRTAAAAPSNRNRRQTRSRWASFFRRPEAVLVLGLVLAGLVLALLEAPDKRTLEEKVAEFNRGVRDYGVKLQAFNDKMISMREPVLRKPTETELAELRSEADDILQTLVELNLQAVSIATDLEAGPNPEAGREVMAKAVAGLGSAEELKEKHERHFAALSG